MPALQVDPAAQCGAGAQQLDQSHFDEARKLLETGFAAARQSAADQLTELNQCALAYGRLQLSVGAKDGAKEALTIALDTARQIGNRKLEGAALRYLGDLYTAEADYTSAVTTYQEALKIASEQNDLANQGAIWSGIGLIYANQAQYSQALDNYQRALKLLHGANNIGARQDEASTHNLIGFAYFQQSNYAQALDAFKQAIDIATQINDNSRQVESYVGIGAAYYIQGRAKESAQAYDQALQLAEVSHNPASKLLALTAVGRSYANQGIYAKAIETYQQALTIADTLKSRDLQQTIHNNLGSVYFSLGQYVQAQEHNQQALGLVRELGNKAREGIVQNNIGTVYKEQGRLTQALDAFTEALTIMREIGNRAASGTILANIGVVYSTQGQYSKANEALQQALSIQQELGNRYGEAVALDNLGDVYRSQGQISQALDMYQKSLTIVREIGDRAGESTVLSNLALLYQNQGQYPKSQELFQQAQDIQQTIGDQASQTKTIGNLAETYRKQGAYTQSLALYQQALTLARGLSNRQAEAITLSNMGLLSIAQGHYAEALDQLQQALEIDRALGIVIDEAAALTNIGGVYLVQGRYDDALAYFKKALAIQHDVGAHVNESILQTSIAAVYKEQGRYQEALDALQQALDIQREAGDLPRESSSMSGMGEVYQDQGRYDEALNSFRQALTISRQLGERGGEGSTLNRIAIVESYQGNYQEALKGFAQALAISQELGDQARVGVILSNIGFAHDRLGHREEALRAYEQAMDVLESVRAVAGSEQGRAAFIAKYSSIYDRAAWLYHQQGQDDQAFATTERGRARAFLDSLATGVVQLNDDSARELFKREQEVYAKRQAVQDALITARTAASKDPTLIADLERQLAAAEQEHTAAVQAIEQRGGQLAALIPGRTGSVISRAEVQRLLDAETTMIAYQVGDDQTLAFILSHDQFQTVTLPVRRDELTAQIQALRQFANTTEALPSSARQLYLWLVEPLKPYLTTSRLAIVPNNVLHYLPFAALGDGTQALINDYTVTILPSASSLPFIQQNAGRTPTAPLILGAPLTNDPHLQPLTFAAREAQAVARLYGVTPLLDAQATTAALRKQAAQAGIVHLAAHGVYTATDALASAIFLAPDGSDDGRFTVRDVYGLNLHATDLVVLSACESQLGARSSGDEVVGLTRAFFFAGTPSVLATLWSVDDEATEQLIERFYTHLRSGQSKADALRQAQLDIRNLRPNPYYWAGFVLSGDAGTTTTQPSWRNFGIATLATLFMIGIAVLLLWSQRKLRQ